MLMGLGIMLAADEVPKIAQTFGLDSSVRVNMMNVVHATTTAVNLTRSVAKGCLKAGSIMEYYKEANKFSKKYGMDAFKIIAAYEDRGGYSAKRAVCRLVRRLRYI